MHSKISFFFVLFFFSPSKLTNKNKNKNKLRSRSYECSLITRALILLPFAPPPLLGPPHMRCPTAKLASPYLFLCSCSLSFDITWNECIEHFAYCSFFLSFFSFTKTIGNLKNARAHIHSEHHWPKTVRAPKLKEIITISIIIKK